MPLIKIYWNLLCIFLEKTLNHDDLSQFDLNHPKKIRQTLNFYTPHVTFEGGIKNENEEDKVFKNNGYCTLFQHVFFAFTPIYSLSASEVIEIKAATWHPIPHRLDHHHQVRECGHQTPGTLPCLF